MKSLHMPLLTVALTLGAVSAAWGAESVMNLISSGEAVQKEVADNRARMEAAVDKNKDLAAKGKELSAEKSKLLADLGDWQKENDDVKQRTDDFKNRCSPDKKLTADQVKACKADADQLNNDIAKVNSDNTDLNKRNDALNAKIPPYNEEAQKAPAEQNAAYDAFNASTKKEGAWLDAAREQLSSDAFKSYGEKAGCPDMNKAPKTTDAMVKMTDDVIACLKRVSSP